MPQTYDNWLDLTAVVSAMCDVINTGRETFGIFYQHRIAARDAGPRSSVLKKAMSRYGDDELKDICKLFTKGDVQQCKRLLCSVLLEINETNNGINRFSDWTEAYQKLGCESSSCP